MPFGLDVASGEEQSEEVLRGRRGRDGGRGGSDIVDVRIPSLAIVNHHFATEEIQKRRRFFTLYDPDLGSSFFIQFHRHQRRSALLVDGRLEALPEEVSASFSADAGAGRRSSVLGQRLQTFGGH